MDTSPSNTDISETHEIHLFHVLTIRSTANIYLLLMAAESLSQLQLLCLVTKDLNSFNRQNTLTKTLITNKCTKGVLSSIVSHSYTFRPCWVIFRENYFFTVTLRLHCTVEWKWSTVLESWNLREGPEISRLQKQRSTQSTAHSHSTVKCNPSVPVTESSPWRWPSRVETCRSVLDWR
jgi:hypothetical protein